MRLKVRIAKERLENLAVDRVTEDFPYFVQSETLCNEFN